MSGSFTITSSPGFTVRAFGPVALNTSLLSAGPRRGSPTEATEAIRQSSGRELDPEAREASRSPGKLALDDQDGPESGLAGNSARSATPVFRDSGYCVRQLSSPSRQA